MREITLKELGYLAKPAKGEINRIFLHWTAGNYHQFFDSYHLNIDEDGSIHTSTYDFTEIKSHTWKRNSNAIGIAMACCVGAQANDGYNTDFGICPPTIAQIEGMAKAVAVLCETLGLEVDVTTVLTHCEIALIDQYGPYQSDPDLRWDLWYLPDSAQNNELVNGGDVIRGKALWFKNKGIN